MDTTQQVISETFAREADRILASLIGTVRDFELAEDALQDALLVALERWPIDGIPRNPGAWMMATSRHKAIDRLRAQCDLIAVAAIGVGDTALSGAQPVQKPACVKRRNIGAIAGRNDQKTFS